jgi:hypothetical protein
MRAIFHAIVTVLVLSLIAFAVWPYVNLYRLNRALIHDEKAALAHFIDLEAIQTQQKAELRREASRVMGKGQNDLSEFFREGARMITDTAVARLVDMNWVRTVLRRDGLPGDARPFPSLLDSVSYAFFEAYDRFVFRLGTLGDDPVHVEMRLKDGEWRVVAIYP